MNEFINSADTIFKPIPMKNNPLSGEYWVEVTKAKGTVEGIGQFNNSFIDCNRTEGRCTESRAIVAGNLLTTEGVVCDIESWTDNAIVFRNDSYCTEEVFTLDLNSNVVNGEGKRVRTDQPVCKMNPSDEEKWGYRLADGFPVYWELRKKSRPAALRVIQAFFGN